jgi:GT2 family glycosyltransferase
MSDEPRVAAVVVTWNRRELLAEALTAVCNQSRRPEAVVVVDNASTDETPSLVAERFPEADLVGLPRNLGGAGGFAAGIERALSEHHPDLLWLLDDDTVPQRNALAALLETRERYPGPRPTVLASRVVWTDGRDHPMNTPRRKPGAQSGEVDRARQVGAAPIRSASFVSIAIDADAVRERGLPIADYFLWNDDFEYTTRLLRGRVGLLCLDSVVVHKTRAFGATDVDPGDRFFYEVRNKVWLFTRSPGLNPLERAAYLGSTLRRWFRTFAASSDRRTLARGLRRGLVAGVRRGPRDTHDLLATARTGPTISLLGGPETLGSLRGHPETEGKRPPRG